jgi:hypothetical protein
VPTPGSRKVSPEVWKSNIPEQLRVLPSWVGSYEKRPLHPKTETGAKVDDPSTWGTYEDACAYVERNWQDKKHCAGLVLRPEYGLIFLDFDSCIGKNSGLVKEWARPLLQPFIGRAYVEVSVSGYGVHVLCYGKLPGPEDRTGARLPIEDGAVEVYRSRRFTTMSGRCELGGATDPTDCQLQLDNFLAATGLGEKLARGEKDHQRTSGDDKDAATLAADLKLAQSALLALDPDCGHDEWLHIGMALHQGLGAKGFDVWEGWSRKGKKYRRGETATRWASFSETGGVTLGSLFHFAKEAGWEQERSTPEEDFAPFLLVSPDPDVEQAEAYELGNLDAWKEAHLHLVIVGSGKQTKVEPSSGEVNLGLYFRHHKRWKGRLKFNIRTYEVELDGRVINQEVIHELACWAQHFCGWRKSPTSNNVVTAVNAIAQQITYDPVKEWLDSLAWDGTPRLEMLLEQLRMEDTPVTRRHFRRWLIGCVARVYRPGCDFQSMLVLFGDQGKKKSSLFKALATKDAWYSESTVDMGGKDGQLALLGPWIVENGELAGMGRTEVERVKVFISERVSKFRPPYGRKVESHPRRVGLGGTTNQDSFLRDDTGSRRFWLVAVPRELDLTILTPDYTAQLWAEAKFAFEQGERWWDEGVEVAQVVELNQEHFEGTALDTWVDTVLHELAPLGATTVTEVLRKLSSKHSIQGSLRQRDIAGAMMRLGWTPHLRRLKLAGESKRGTPARFWAPPLISVDKAQVAAVLAFKRNTEVSDFQPVNEGGEDLV